jgi:hypothetical protein
MYKLLLETMPGAMMELEEQMASQVTTIKSVVLNMFDNYTSLWGFRTSRVSTDQLIIATMFSTRTETVYSSCRPKACLVAHLLLLTPW